MAQAQVTITAVDRTQAAINSAMRSMKTLERTAKVTAKAVNLAFGLLTGSILVSAFGKITEAAKKTEEGRRALDNLGKALKDPALVSAANTFTTTLINGFTEVVKFAAETVRAVTKVGRELGVIAQPIDRSQFGKGEGGRSGRVYKSMATEHDRTKAYSAILHGRLELEKELAEKEEKRLEKIKQAAAELDRLNQMTMTSTEKTLAEFVEFEQAIDKLLRSGRISQEVATARMKEQIDEILPGVEVTGKREIIPGAKEKLTQLTVFAEEAARQMQQSFAAFLFDPFQDGLRGMLRGFVNVIRQMLAQIISQQLLVAFFSVFAGGTGFFANFAKTAIASIEGRARGGPVSAGRPYIVGERGPELFVPNSSGGIVSNGAMMGGMTLAPVYNIDARGATADLQAALPGILQENNRRIFEELDRRYGVGR
jgi:hypothetical protein